MSGGSGAAIGEREEEQSEASGESKIGPGSALRECSESVEGIEWISCGYLSESGEGSEGGRGDRIVSWGEGGEGPLGASAERLECIDPESLESERSEAEVCEFCEKPGCESAVKRRELSGVTDLGENESASSTWVDASLVGKS